MTKELLNEVMNALIDGTLFGICFGFWVMVLVGIWRWFIGVIKRFLQWLCPNLFHHKDEETNIN